MHPTIPCLVCTYDEAAVLLNVSRRTIAHLVKCGDLRSVSRGRVARTAINVYRSWRYGVPDGYSTSGYVYLIYWQGYHKIGFAQNVAQRVRDITCSHPISPVVVHTIPTDSMLRLELHFHERFAARRVSGEWFALTEADIEYIRSCKAYITSHF